MKKAGAVKVVRVGNLAVKVGNVLFDPVAVVLPFGEVAAAGHAGAVTVEADLAAAEDAAATKNLFCREPRQHAYEN